MKVIFWKNRTELFAAIFFTLISVVLGVLFLILNRINTGMWIAAVFFLTTFLIALCWILFQKNILSKIEISDRGLRCLRFNKERLFIKWDDISDVKRSYYGKNIFLTFVSVKGQIDIDLYKKIYDSIIEFCPFDSIKDRISNLEFMEHFKK